MAPGGGAAAEAAGGPPDGGWPQAIAARARPGSPGESAIVFNIDAEKLPKASDLKSYLFPSTIAISVTDQDIRIVSREAFPDFASLVGACAGGGDDARRAEHWSTLSKLADKSQTPALRPARTAGCAAAARPGGRPAKAAPRPGGASAELEV